MAFMRNISAGYVLFCRTKENQKGRRCPEGMKAPVGLLSRRPVCEANAACLARQGHSDFDALEPTGCGPLRLLRALGDTRILQAAAPTAPPCIRHWRRSSPLQTRGCSPLIIPRQRSKRKNASRFAQRIFFFFSLLRFAGPSVAARQLPTGRDKREYKNNFSTDYGQSARGGHFK